MAWFLVVETLSEHGSCVPNLAIPPHFPQPQSSIVYKDSGPLTTPYVKPLVQVIQKILSSDSSYSTSEKLHTHLLDSPMLAAFLYQDCYFSVQKYSTKILESPR
jgi:hypothetical protein